MSDVLNPNFEFQKAIAILAVTLMALKFMAYLMTGSVAIYTDAMESIVNVVAAAIGLVAIYVSMKPADRNHPFGHGKVEIISATIEGAMILTAGGIIILQSIRSIMNPEPVRDLDVGLVLVAVTAVANYLFGRHAIKLGTKRRSEALVASGNHLCSDTYSSVGIIIGLTAVYILDHAGIEALWLDPIIALVFGLVIIYTGTKVLRQSMNEVMDRADEELLDSVADCIKGNRHNDWIDIYDLRLIKYGAKIYVHAHVVVPRDKSMEWVMGEMDELDATLKERFGENIDSSITPYPCRDFCCYYCDRECPRRSEEFGSKSEWNKETMCKSFPYANRKPIRIS